MELRKPRAGAELRNARAKADLVGMWCVDRGDGPP